MIEKIIAELNDALFDTDRDRALEIVHNALQQGVTPEDIVMKVIASVLHGSVDIMADQEVNLAQHYLTAQIAMAVTEEMLPQFKKKAQIAGRVVIGTAFGDLHSVGMRIVGGCLRAFMIEVKDVGVNVPAEVFVDAALEYEAQVIGVSAMMMHTATGEEGAVKIRRILQEKGLEDRIKLVVGGAPYHFDPELYKSVGADAWSDNGVDGAGMIASLLKEVQQ